MGFESGGYEDYAKGINVNPGRGREIAQDTFANAD
jgi:hypothetical protein